MTLRLLGLSLAPLFVAATAHAQAPGEWAPEPSYAQPPPAFVPAPVSRPQKWSIGVVAGQTELAPKEGAATSVIFDTGSLAFRYRGWRHLEVELTIGGGRSYQPNDQIGEQFAMSTGTLAARYRFNPENNWNWWLLAGLGMTAVAPVQSTDEQIKAAQRGHGTLGIGLEHRWTRLALQAEMRALSTGQTTAEKDLMDQGTMASAGLTGGSFTLGASVYF